MKIVDGKLELGIRECWQCNGTRKINEWIRCERCNGSGKATANKRGRNCAKCQNQRYTFDHSVVLSIGTGVCKSCVDGTQVETVYDYAPKEMWNGLRFVVYHSDRKQTYNEYLLGIGCAWATTDYGNHKRLSNTELIAKVRDDAGSIQACKFAKEDGTLCDHIGIFCNDNGYIVKSVYTDAFAIQADLARGLDVANGFALGVDLANAGFNGTMLAAEVRK